MNLKLAGAALAVLVIAGGVYWLAGRDDGQKGVACTLDAKLCPDGTAVGRTGPDCSFAPCPSANPGSASTTQAEGAHEWTFEEAELSPDRIPHTRVFIDGRFVGSYEGSCSDIAGSSWELLPGESSGVICWWAGGGTEAGVFGNEVRVGQLDEGSAEVPGFRGDFKTAFTL